MGIVVYYATRELPAAAGKRKRLSAWLLFFATLWFFTVRVHYPIAAWRDVPSDMLVVGCVLLALTLHPWSFLVNRVTQFLGKISYSFYLLHFFTIEALPKLSAAVTHHPDSFFGRPYGNLSSFFVLMLVSLVVTIPLATLSWKWLEQPGMTLGRKIIRAREHHLDAALARL